MTAADRWSICRQIGCHSETSSQTARQIAFPHNAPHKDRLVHTKSSPLTKTSTVPGVRFVIFFRRLQVQRSSWLVVACRIFESLRLIMHKVCRFDLIRISTRPLIDQLMSCHPLLQLLRTLSLLRLHCGTVHCGGRGCKCFVVGDRRMLGCTSVAELQSERARLRSLVSLDLHSCVHHRIKSVHVCSNPGDLITSQAQARGNERRHSRGESRTACRFLGDGSLLHGHKHLDDGVRLLARGGRERRLHQC